MDKRMQLPIRIVFSLLIAGALFLSLAVYPARVFSASETPASTYSIQIRNINSDTVLKKGKKLKLKYTATKETDGVSEKAKVLFKSSNKKIATVSKKGVIKAKKNGTVKITVYCKANKKVKKTVKIKVGTPVSSIKLSGYRYLRPGASTTLKAAVSKKATNKKVTWSSDNESVAVVNDSGKVTAVSFGACNIHARAKDGSGVDKSIKVYVPLYKAEDSFWIAHRGLHTDATENTAKAFEAAGKIPGMDAIECDIWETKAQAPSMPLLPSEPPSAPASSDEVSAAEENASSDTVSDPDEVSASEEAPESSIPEDEVSELASQIAALPDPATEAILDSASEVESAWNHYTALSSKMNDSQKWAVRLALMTDSGDDLLQKLFRAYKRVETYQSLGIVINHDPDFSLIFGVRKNVYDMTAAEIRSQLPEVCFFETYLDICKEYNKVPVVELKSLSTEGVKKAVDMMAERDLLKGSILCSFDAGILSDAHARSKKLLGGNAPDTYFLFYNKADANLKTAVKYGFTGIGVRKNILTEKLVKNARAKGLKVGTWAYYETAVDCDYLFNHLNNKAYDYALDYITVDYIPF